MNYQAILSNMGFTTEQFLLLAVGASLVICFILFIWNIVQQSKIKQMKKAYESLMRGKEGIDLEELLQVKFDALEEVQEVMKEQELELEKIRGELQYSLSKTGLVRYNAFDVSAGNLSFAIALLDKEDTGYLLNVIHGREGCYVYTKQIIHAESNIELSEEEARAVNLAVSQRKSTDL